jgi:hypothetical protein
MNKFKLKWRIARLIVITLLALLLAAQAYAAPLAEAIDWWFTGGGGGTSSSSNITLSDTVGQAAAGVSSNGDIVLQDGYWVDFSSTEYYLYLPTLRR